LDTMYLVEYRLRKRGPEFTVLTGREN